MVFSSLTFICVFLPVVWILYLVVPSIKIRNLVLIAASLFFYAFGEPVYVLLMIVSTIVNYGFGRVIGSFRNSLEPNTPEVREGASAGEVDVSGARGKYRLYAKIAVISSIVVNLGFLAVFKYASMFVSTVDGIFSLSLTIPIIALPIGISFYTFQAMSYVIDVYRGQVIASKSYVKVLLYISFFPQLIAGPIIKYHDIERELTERKVTINGVASGFRRFTVGLGKKVLIANTMAVVVDSIYGSGAGAGAGEVGINFAVAWLAALAYILQIYFDFSGYSDMAIGLARMFGFHYKENFNYPYTSSSIKEFWRRWHISLSTWFKEYLYIPLGGNRKGRLRGSLNKIVVFFFCGLWHGASWTFVVWGLFHGLFLLLEDYLPIKKLPKALGVVYALVVVTVGFVIFRANSIDQAFYFIQQMFTGFYFDAPSTSLLLEHCTPFFIVVAVVALFACLPIRSFLDVKITDVRVRSVLSNASLVLSLALLVLCMLDLSVGGYNPFIYFRF